jgi:hypothetical protein
MPVRAFSQKVRLRRIDLATRIRLWYHAVQSDDCGRVGRIFAAQSSDCDGTV